MMESIQRYIEYPGIVDSTPISDTLCSHAVRTKITIATQPTTTVPTIQQAPPQRF